MTPDGHYAICETSRRNYNVLRVWDIESGRTLQSLIAHFDEINAVAITADGRRAVSVSGGSAWDSEVYTRPLDCSLKVWDLEAGRELLTLVGHSERVKDVAVTPDGRRAVSVDYKLFSSDSTIKLWDLKNGKMIASFVVDSGLQTCAIASDGMTVVVGDRSGQLHFLRLEGVS
jgi:WD40 repeat protein